MEKNLNPGPNKQTQQEIFRSKVNRINHPLLIIKTQSNHLPLKNILHGTGLQKLGGCYWATKTSMRYTKTGALKICYKSTQIYLYI